MPLKASGMETTKEGTLNSKEASTPPSEQHAATLGQTQEIQARAPNAHLALVGQMAPPASHSGRDDLGMASLAGEIACLIWQFISN